MLFKQATVYIAFCAGIGAHQRDASPPTHTHTSPTYVTEAAKDPETQHGGFFPISGGGGGISDLQRSKTAR